MSQGILRLQNVCVMAFVLALSACGVNLPKYIESGKTKYENKDYTGALNVYTEAIELWIKDPLYKDPRDVSILYAKRADIKCHHLNDFQGAMDDYHASIRVAEEYRELLVKYDPGAIDDYALSRVYESRATCKERVMVDTAEDRSAARTYSSSASKKASSDEAARVERARSAQGPSVWELNAEAARKKVKEMEADHSYKTSPYYGTGCKGSASCR